MIAIIIVFIYICLMTFGLSLHPERKYYNKLFDFNTYLFHFITSLAISAYGIYYCLNVNGSGAFFFAPSFFLILFLLLDKLTKLIINRHIIIATRWDYKPSFYKWYLDGLFSILLFSIPFLLSGIIMNKLNFGTFFR